MYSQNNEESIIVNYFKSNHISHGKFLDIGAYDGKTFSNTHKLAEMGWAGVCYEPSSKPFAALRLLYSGNSRIVVINSAVGQTNGVIRFFDSNGNAVSTTDVSHKTKWEKSSIKFNEIVVNCTSAKDVIIRHGLKYDFVNIDTEGTNVQILRVLIDAGLKFNLLCVEHDGNIEQIIKMFPGCVNLLQNGENIILKR
jgi:FkbM family methyltransferase